MQDNNDQYRKNSAKIPSFFYQKEKGRIITVWVWNFIKKHLKLNNSWRV